MRRAIAATMLLLLAFPLAAQDAQPVELSLSPRAIESPVLKYRLFPAEAERKRGNAATILLRLPWEQAPYMQQVYPKLHEWDSRPLDAPEWKDFAGVFPSRFYDEMKRAAYRRDAEWEYPIGEEPAYFILLPDVQGLRTLLGRGLAAKARYHITRSELDEARETILVGLANAHHMAQTPFFVNQLVVATMERSFLDRTAELISQPESPNLYWALAALPDSLTQLERAASLEASMFTMTFPAADELDRPRDAAEWKNMFDQLVKVLEFADGVTVDRAKLTLAARSELPALLEMPADKVAAMSDEEVAVRWAVRTHRQRDQKVAAVLCLPPREAWPRLAELEAEMEATRETSGLAERNIFNPAAVFSAAWSVPRKIAALRIIEAVRHHLAKSDGKLPQNLNEIEGLSIPHDPLTDQPFEWKVESDVATLKAPPLPFVPDKVGTAHEIEYRLRVR